MFVRCIMGQWFNAMYFSARCSWLRMRLRHARKRQVRDDLSELRRLDAFLGDGWDVFAATVYENARTVSCFCAWSE